MFGCLKMSYSASGCTLLKHLVSLLVVLNKDWPAMVNLTQMINSVRFGWQRSL